MATGKERNDTSDQKGYRLLSVNKVKKILGVGSNTVLKLIESGEIESVNTDGKFRVPECKLDKFINQQNNFINGSTNQKSIYKDDEDKAQSIIENLNGN